ncbi:MAG: adenylate/guanylate cyclase domain-containing response regulator [Desulfobacterales bacterium]|nr:adenylate/guanylate cyclase domain-containing response regulator [Desulfobacterales bacterium]
MNGLLFIDDEEGVRRSVARALKREPYELYVAKNGEAGIALVEQNHRSINTVVSDYRMPGIDGLETLGAIGRINPEMTRIILTGYATMEAAIDATNQGIDGFLTKPFDNKSLRANIRGISVKKHLRQFVTEQVYNELQSSPGALAPAFHEVTVLFADIRGFTSMSQTVSPERLANFLNDSYFTPLGEIAYAHGGIVDKHLGDGIMIVFGALGPCADDPLRAVEAAAAMQKTAGEIDCRLRRENGLRLRIGIGISTGTVFSGLLGSIRKKEFTSVGLAVNIAARLEALAAPGEILISENTGRTLADRLGHPSVSIEALEPAQVKGLDDPIEVYRVVYRERTA